MKSNDATNNAALLDWVNLVRELCKPDAVQWCDGSEEEYDALCARWSRAARSSGSIPIKRPRSYLCARPIRATSRASRTGRSSARKQKNDAGPTNNWMDPDEMKCGCSAALRRLA